MSKLKAVNVQMSPITDVMFKRQGWERYEENDDETFYYWVLPLPKDTPDDEAPSLISSANDEWEELGIPEGTYVVEIFEMNGLGYCEFEEETELLYRVLTGRDIYEK